VHSYSTLAVPTEVISRLDSRGLIDNQNNQKVPKIYQKNTDSAKSKRFTITSNVPKLSTCNKCQSQCHSHLYHSATKTKSIATATGTTL